jgi:hypothetical protein
MNKRPLSLTVVGWGFVCVGCVAMVEGVLTFLGPSGPASTPGREYQDSRDLAWVAVSAIMAIAGGAFVLRGKNWARWLLALWMGLHLILNILHSPSEVIVHSVLFTGALYLLFRRSASAWVRGVTTEPS